MAIRYLTQLDCCITTKRVLRSFPFGGRKGGKGKNQLNSAQYYHQAWEIGQFVCSTRNFFVHRASKPMLLPFLSWKTSSSFENIFSKVIDLSIAFKKQTCRSFVENQSFQVAVCMFSTSVVLFVRVIALYLPQNAKASHQQSRKFKTKY